MMRGKIQKLVIKLFALLTRSRDERIVKLLFLRVPEKNASGHGDERSLLVIDRKRKISFVDIDYNLDWTERDFAAC